MIIYMMIKYYDLPAESMLVGKVFEQGALYICADTGNIYLDSAAGNRVNVGGSLIILETEDERSIILAPIPCKFYYVKDSNKLYVYITDWVCINDTVQANWDQNDETAKDYIVNKPTISHPVDKENHMVQPVGRDEDGLLYASNIFDGIIMKDRINGYSHVIEVQDGALVSYIRVSSIEVTTHPNKMDYTIGEPVDLSGMVITCTREDGTTFDITDYNYNDTPVLDSIFKVYYIEGGIKHEASIEFNTTPFDPETVLVDFYYTSNSDGTYSITDWKGTLNGESSTEIIIPDNTLIKL